MQRGDETQSMARGKWVGAIGSERREIHVRKES